MSNLNTGFAPFDPHAPLAPLPPADVERLLAAYNARPPRVVTNRYVWIVTSTPDADTLLHARCAALSAFRLAATGWTVVMCESDPAKQIISETCAGYAIPLVITSQRQAWSLADKVVSFDRLDIVRLAIRRRIPVCHNRQWIPVQLALPLAA